MHGAYASGESQAKKILEYFQIRDGNGSHLCYLRNYLASVGNRIFKIFSSVKLSEAARPNAL